MKFDPTLSTKLRLVSNREAKLVSITLNVVPQNQSFFQLEGVPQGAVLEPGPAAAGAGDPACGADRGGSARERPRVNAARTCVVCWVLWW